MKIAGYSQPNLSRQSFGAVISFRDVTQATRNLPNYAKLDRVIGELNLSQRVANLQYHLAILSHVRVDKRPRGFWRFRLEDKIVDIWHLVSPDGMTSKPIEIPREKPSLRKLAKQLWKAGVEIEYLYGKSYAERRGGWPLPMEVV